MFGQFIGILYLRGLCLKIPISAGGRQSVERAIRRDRKGDVLLGFDQEPHRSFGLGLLGAGLMFGSYWLLWGSVDGFVNAIDHGEQPFGDFRRFYYPMGEVLFAEKWPVRGILLYLVFCVGAESCGTLAAGGGDCFVGVFAGGVGSRVLLHIGPLFAWTFCARHAGLLVVVAGFLSLVAQFQNGGRSACW